MNREYLQSTPLTIPRKMSKNYASMQPINSYFNYDTVDQPFTQEEYVHQVEDTFVRVNNVKEKRSMAATAAAKETRKIFGPSVIMSNPAISNAWQTDHSSEGNQQKSYQKPPNKYQYTDKANTSYHGGKQFEQLSIHQEHINPIISEEDLRYNDSYYEIKNAKKITDLAAGDQTKKNEDPIDETNLKGYQHCTASGLGFKHVENDPKVQSYDTIHANFMLAANRGEPHPMLEECSSLKIARLEEVKKVLLELITSEQEKFKIQEVYGTQSKHSFDQTKFEQLENVKVKKINYIRQIEETLARLKDLEETGSETALANLEN